MTPHRTPRLALAVFRRYLRAAIVRSREHHMPLVEQALDEAHRRDAVLLLESHRIRHLR
ncbi:hypothetical protein AB0J38_24860 [Streptomyces sp. NPDC050095]|uniref:hypothetical protein n=1 Tax=unclassified Streptomyces TaxID=2593676 RepID=UPI0034231AE9